LRFEGRSDFIVPLFGQLAGFAVHFAGRPDRKLKPHGIVEIFGNAATS
jgi:hypothetical protein